MNEWFTFGGGVYTYPPIKIRNVLRPRLSVFVSGVTVLSANPNTIWYNGNTTDSTECRNPANFYIGSEL